MNRSTKQQLFCILFLIKPTTLMRETIYWAMRSNGFDKLISELYQQSIDAPKELEEIIGERAVKLLRKREPDFVMREEKKLMAIV